MLSQDLLGDERPNIIVGDREKALHVLAVAVEDFVVDVEDIHGMAGLSIGFGRVTCSMHGTSNRTCLLLTFVIQSR